MTTEITYTTFHFRLLELPVDPIDPVYHTNGGVTVVFRNNRGELSYGVSIGSTQDSYDPERGRRIAMGRSDTPRKRENTVFNGNSISDLCASYRDMERLAAKIADHFWTLIGKRYSRADLRLNLSPWRRNYRQGRIQNPVINGVLMKIEEAEYGNRP